MISKKLKSTEIKEIRISLLKEQSYCCAICGLSCSEEEAVLDHSHQKEQGWVRGVLHRGCNTAEGKIINTMRRYGIKEYTKFLSGLISYYSEHSENKTGLIHPQFKTLEEKKILAKKRRIRKNKEKQNE